MIEVVGWLLYAIPMLTIVLVPDAVRPRVRADGRRRRRRRGAGRAARRHARRRQGDERGRSPAPAARRTVNVAITDAGCEPATLKLASGPTTFVVTNKGSSKVTEYEVIQGDRALAEVENVTDGLTGASR